MRSFKYFTAALLLLLLALFPAYTLANESQASSTDPFNPRWLAAFQEGQDKVRFDLYWDGIEGADLYKVWVSQDAEHFYGWETTDLQWTMDYLSDSGDRIFYIKAYGPDGRELATSSQYTLYLADEQRKQIGWGVIKMDAVINQDFGMGSILSGTENGSAYFFINEFERTLEDGSKEIIYDLKGSGLLSTRDVTEGQGARIVVAGEGRLEITGSLTRKQVNGQADPTPQPCTMQLKFSIIFPAATVEIWTEGGYMISTASKPTVVHYFANVPLIIGTTLETEHVFYNTVPKHYKFTLEQFNLLNGDCL